jgi:uncharacterized protein YjbI with pentapeptide repeats
MLVADNRMANPEHLEILKQGVKAWNKWRQEHPKTSPDLSNADLSGVNLSRADLRGINLSEANLSKADLSGATLITAILYWTDLSEADLTHANLNGADLTHAVLNEADLTYADLSGADFLSACLIGANLFGAKLSKADLKEAGLGLTVMANTDLSNVKGLASVGHFGPSFISIDTFFRSGGTIPEVFLRGAGVPDIFIEYAASLAGKPIEFYSAFISYSSKDEDLAKRLHADLQAKGVRCWFAPEDLKLGDKFRTEIDRAIRLHDKLLLLLSANSILSDWVEKEVETAFDRERRDKRTVLFPVRLDDSIMDAVDGWAADIRRTRHIGDFTKWKDHDAYQKAFDRLLRDLKAGAKSPEADKKG